MDSMLRNLERLAAMGDTQARARRNRLLYKVRNDRLQPCITLCPKGTNIPFKPSGKLTYLRMEYVSIYLDMGDWRDHPTVYTSHGIGCKLSNDSFLRKLFKLPTRLNDNYVW